MVIYSDDEDIAKFSRDLGLTVIPVRDLPLPPEDTQQSLLLSAPGEDESSHQGLPCCAPHPLPPGPQRRLGALVGSSTSYTEDSSFIFL